MRRNRALKIIIGGVVATVVLLASAGVVVRMLLAASLPRTRGEVVLSSPSQPVLVELDAHATPRIIAETYADAAHGLGFAHAQNRFFQMDLLRSAAAGRLAELLGRPLLELDHDHRAYRFEDRARRMLGMMPPAHRKVLEAYGEGVNAGLDDLGARPPEYLLLGLEPRPWQPHDCLLVQDAMFLLLSFGLYEERMKMTMRRALPEPLVAMLTPDTTEFDAPIPGEAAPPDPPPIPGPDVFSLREPPRRSDPDAPSPTPEIDPFGSNNWAVAGSRTEGGRAIVANDMHLFLSVPNTWYRAELRWEDRRAYGVTLPGFPGVVVGSTDDLAWGFTNAMADTQDLVIVEELPNDRSRYRTPEGPEEYGTITEVFRIRGEPSTQRQYRLTRWGPITGRDHDGNPLALRWPALDADKTNIALLDVLDARSVDEAVAIAERWYGPPQNVVFADRAGRIAWTISGWLPRRKGLAGDHPVSWASPGVGWFGQINGDDRPRLIDPPAGFIATANNRAAGVNRSRLLGRDWALGGRASRIAQLLGGRTSLDESDLAEIQLDTRVPLLERYRDLIIESVDRSASVGVAQDVIELLRRWGGYADRDERAVTILENFRTLAHDACIDPLLAPCMDIDEDFEYRWFQSDGVVVRLLAERPAHLLDPSFDTWDELIAATLRDAVEASRDERGRITPWGQANRARIAHPIGRVVPLLGGLVNMPSDPLPGHRHAVRTQMPSFGASERIVVSPSAPRRSHFQMPCGQSGHPLSRHYDDLNPMWVKGESIPLPAGEAVRSFRILPRGTADR